MIGAVTLGLALRISEMLGALLQGLSLTAGPTVVILFAFFAPRLCRIGSAFWTVVAGLAVMALWHTVPRTHLVTHVIYLEWIVCVGVFLLVPLFDSRRIDPPDGSPGAGGDSTG